jgi:predicted GNAT superfamily acetyltransferase
VAATTKEAGRTGFRYRRLTKPEEFRAAEELQREAFGMDGEVPTGATLQRAFQDEGGLVLGAFADIYLAGVNIGFLGWDGQELYHYAQITAVRPEYQNHHVGFQLNAFLREEVLRRGLARVRALFDPLQSRAAHLVVRRLGATPDRYLPHYYGQLDSESDRGLETDRLRFTWDLNRAEVVSRLAGKLPSAEDDRAQWERSTALVETELTDEGFRHPAAVSETELPETHLEIPFDLGAIREHAPNFLRPWRHAVRDAFRASLDTGYAVTDFAVLNVEHERRSFYFLAKQAPAPPPDPASPAPG